MRAVSATATALGSLALLCGSGAVSAQSCSVAPQGVLFGGYDTLAPGPTDGVGRVHVDCDTALPITIALGPGSGSQGAREMRSGANSLSYDLYSDAARLARWGEDASAVSASGGKADLTVYGRIPARQNIPAGAYSDVVTITVSF